MNRVPEITIHDADLKIKTVTYHDRVVVSRMASVALDFMKIHMPASMLADVCSPDGTQKLTFEEIVDRSIRLTELAYSALDEKGWVATLPALEEMAEDDNRAGFLK
jgi:tagatose-1,6-bisphosphate aldolase non-catalytic subunit AgaZ/GatZ